MMRFAIVLVLALSGGAAVAQSQSPAPESGGSPTCNLPREKVLADIAGADLHVIATLRGADAQRFLDASNGPAVDSPSLLVVDSPDGASALVLVFSDDCLFASARFALPALNAILGRMGA